VPGKIVEVTQADDDPVTGRTAVVDFQGTRVEASLAAVPAAVEGNWVLVHAGFAIAVLNEAEARETFETLRLALGEDLEIPGLPPRPHQRKQ